jgi:glutamine cyclotransferase
MATLLQLVVPLVVFSACCAAPAQEQAPTPPAADGKQAPAPPEVTHYQYKVVRTYPHDRQSFTQGLVYQEGLIYEGTGLYGRSAILRWDLKTGNVLKKLRLPDKYFGEGITLFEDKLIELTWKSKVGFVYSKDTFTPRTQFRYPMEGWGLTHDGKRLILSDGTATLHFLDPNTYAEIGRLEVRNDGRPIRNINELEFIDGQIYANVWPSDMIVTISPKTGRITGMIDMVGLYSDPGPRDSDAVLNGIAYMPETRHLLVTGKLWPKLYEIELLPPPAQPLR